MAAQASEAPLTFTAGWVRVTLAACAGARPDAPASRLLVASDRRLTFTPGRRGGATLALLGGTAAPSDGRPQVFTLAGGSAAREVVLAPWSGPSPLHVTAIRLLGP